MNDLSLSCSHLIPDLLFDFFQQTSVALVSSLGDVLDAIARTPLATRDMIPLNPQYAAHSVGLFPQLRFRILNSMFSVRVVLIWQFIFSKGLCVPCLHYFAAVLF